MGIKHGSALGINAFLTKLVHLIPEELGSKFIKIIWLSGHMGLSCLIATKSVLYILHLLTTVQWMDDF